MRASLILFLSLALSASAANWFVDSSQTGTSANTGTSAANAWTNWVPLGGTDGQWTGVAHGGDIIWIAKGVGYTGNRTGVPDGIVMFNVLGISNNPIVFKTIQTNGIVKTPPFAITGSFFTLDGGKDDNFTNTINLDNMANLYQITNNINWWIRGVYGFGSNQQNGIYCPNSAPQMKFKWIHVDPYTYNTNNYPFGGSSSGVGANTHGINILQNTGELLDGLEIGYCYIEHADQTDINLLNNNAPHWQQGRIHHNVLTMVGDAGGRIAGGMEIDHNIVGHAWTIHGHPNGLVVVPNYSLVHHNIIFNTLDTMMYTPGGGSPIAFGIKVYDNLWYTTKDWSFLYTNEFSGNLPFVNHSIAGIQFLVEANANHTLPWLPQTWTNFFFGANTMICGLGAVATNANAGINGPISLPNRDAPGSPDTLADAGFVYLTNFTVVDNCIYNVSPSNFGQSLGGFPGWLDRFNPDTNTWTSPVTNSVAGILFSQLNTNSPNPNTGSTNLLFDYNDMAADLTAVATFAYNGPNSTNSSYTAATFNAAYGTNGYIHNQGGIPSLFDTNNYDFHPRVNDTVLVGKGTNLSTFAGYPGGLPQYTMDLSGVTRPSTPTIGAYEPRTDVIWATVWDDLAAPSSPAIGVQPFVTDLTGYGGNLLYWGFTSTPTNWPVQVAWTNPIGGFNHAAQFVSNTNLIPAYNNFTIAQFGGITNVNAFSNLTAITVIFWAKYFSSQGDIKDNSATIIDTQDGSPGNGATWSLGRNSAYQTSFDLFTNLNYNTSGSLHLNFPDNESVDWHMYAATFNCTNFQMNIYLDGTNCGFRDLTGYSTALTNLIVGVPSSSGSYGGKNGWISIGCRTHNGSPNLADGDQFPNNGWFDGQLGAGWVYNRALGTNEILAIYNGGSGTGGGGGGGGGPGGGGIKISPVQKFTVKNAILP